MSLLDPAVRAGWPGYSAVLEGAIETLYRDVKGLVTTGAGILCDSPAAAARFAWVRPDRLPATSAEVNTEWHRVHNLPPGMVWSRYAGPSALRLAPGELDRLAWERLDADATELARVFPELPSWPAPAQAATLSMAWAMGAGFPASWPHWSASARAQDWRACAANCEIRWENNPGVRPRDLAQRALFLLAAGDDLETACAGWPAGPSADAARRALDGLGLEAFDSRTTLPTGGAPAVDVGQG